MNSDLLFTYMIKESEVKIYKLNSPVKLKSTNDPFYNGLIAAIAEYLYYPVDVIAPRLNQFNIKFVYDDNDLVDTREISECTKHVVLYYMDTHPEQVSLFIPKYATEPHVSEKLLSDWICGIRDEIEQSHILIDVVKTEKDYKWLRFDYKHHIFYGRYKGNYSPYLIVSLPCYNSDWNDISYLHNDKCDILQLSPLGYNTPNGFNNDKRLGDTWPVLYDTLTETDENSGYNLWFTEVAMAIHALRKEMQELIFVGTSQGGGAALVLSSIFNNMTVACAAEMPFLIGFSDKRYDEVKNLVADKTGKMVYDFYAKERMFVIDPIQHVDRIRSKTLLLAGENDNQCPKEDIFELYNKLRCEKKYVLAKGAGHGYTEEFQQLLKEWLDNIL